jgi:hypothetical protein
MRSWSGALLASMAWFVVGPGSALAQCSSHAIPSIPLAWESGKSHGSLDLSGNPAAAEAGDTPRVPKPCTGAMCSGRSAVPMTPAPAQVLRVGVWAILEPTTAMTSTDPLDARRDEGTVRPTRHPSLIFHPPRLPRSLPTS